MKRERLNDLKDRTYRMAMNAEEALEELLRYSGTQFDPAIVRVFEKNVAGTLENI